MSKDFQPQEANSTKALLNFSRISKHFGPFKAVDDLDLDVVPGEFLTLLGPSGSGKTTLLMMLAGFTTPTSGRIDFNGADISGLPPEKRNFGMVFQGYALFPHMTVAQNVEYPLQVRKIPKAEREQLVSSALALVQMDRFADRLPKQLSGGQQQRVALARAMVFGPKIMLLDEPLGALDRQLRASLQEELKALHQKLGTTFICVTHDQDEAMSMADRIVVMRNGRIVQVGPPLEIYERPQTRFVADFLGESNLFYARSVGRDGDKTILKLGNQTLAIRGAEGKGEQVAVSVRPERLLISDQPKADQFCLPATISDVTFVGVDRRVRLETELAGPIIARVRDNVPPVWLRKGAQVWAHCDTSNLWCVAEDD